MLPAYSWVVYALDGARANRRGILLRPCYVPSHLAPINCHNAGSNTQKPLRQSHSCVCGSNACGYPLLHYGYPAAIHGYPQLPAVVPQQSRGFTVAKLQYSRWLTMASPRHTKGNPLLLCGFSFASLLYSLCSAAVDPMPCRCTTVALLQCHCSRTDSPLVQCYGHKPILSRNL